MGFNMLTHQHAAPQVEASAIPVRSAQVLDIAWYKDGKLALLCQRPAEGGLPPRSWLVLADTLGLEFVEVPPECPDLLQVRPRLAARLLEPLLLLSKGHETTSPLDLKCA